MTTTTLVYNRLQTFGVFFWFLAADTGTDNESPGI